MSLRIVVGLSLRGLSLVRKTLSAISVATLPSWGACRGRGRRRSRTRRQAAPDQRPQAVQDVPQRVVRMGVVDEDRVVLSGLDRLQAARDGGQVLDAALMCSRS